MQELPFGQYGRLFAGVLLLGLLGGCLLWAGTTAEDPLSSTYPDEIEVTPSPESYVGEQVRLGGIVVETDPVVIATRRGGYGRFTAVDANDHLLNADGPLERGDRVTVVGPLDDESTLVAERVITGESSETRSMIVISFVGGLWVAGRFVRDWRFDRSTLAFVPRPKREPRSDRGHGEATDSKRGNRSGKTVSDEGDRRD